jgi:hypothetical protein
MLQNPSNPPAAGVVQTNLMIDQPGDIYEQEADRVSEQVLHMPGQQRGLEHERVQTKCGGSSSFGPAAVPPIVQAGLRSPGQFLNPATRAFMEARFGEDFSKVRVHANEAAARSAEGMVAQAYTVGSDIVFGAGHYEPASGKGQRLLAHELAHVVQQQSKPAVQRQPLLGDRSQTIPTDLVSSADVGHMSEQELIERHDRILEVLGRFNVSTPETALLEQEVARIGVELGRRRALTEGRTFAEDAITKMKEYFQQNASKPAKPRDNPPPAPPGGWQDSCIVALNKGMKIVTGKPALPTTPETIEKTMEKIAAGGHSGTAREVWFDAKNGKLTRGGARPETLQASIWDTVLSLAGGDPGWSVFTMSIDDGNHSVTLTLDANNPSAPRVYWSDQWSSKGGWKEYTRAELDAEVTRLVQGWWDKQKEGRKFKPVVRLWRVRATAATTGP